MSPCPGKRRLTDPVPLLSPPAHCRFQQREWINEQVRDHHRNNELPGGVPRVCGEPLAGWKKNQRERLFLRAAITHRRCWNEMMNVNAWTSWEMATSQCKCGSIKEGSHPSGTAVGEAGEKKGELNFQSGRLSCGLYFLLYPHCSAYLLLGLINFSLMPR